MKMKTVFVTIFQAVEAKNILRTGVIQTLLASPEVRVVCLTRFPERSEYYAREVAHERLTYEAFYEVPAGQWERFFSWLKVFLIRTATTDLRRRMRLQESGRYFRYGAGQFLNWLLARRQVRKAARFFDGRLVAEAGFGKLFEKYRPGAVFLANLFDDAEIALLREARRRGIPTVALINSWDKLTARYAVRLLPDTMVVFNNIVKREAAEFADMPEERIVVAGVPQYDWHVNAPLPSREEFFKKRGLDPRRALVVFAPMGREFSNSDWEAVDLLHSLVVADKELASSVELLVRFQPNDFSDEEELKRRPWLKYDVPGTRFGSTRGGDWDMNFAELAHLSASLAHMDVLVCYASSMSVDAAIFGKPVININFELRAGEPWSKSPTFYYATEHYKKALASGGIRLVNTPQELVRRLRAYLENPELDAEGRKRLVREQCWRLDGQAGERVAQAVLGSLPR